MTKTSFAIYLRLSKKQLAKAVKYNIQGITSWFEVNPKRKICNTQWVYGEPYKVRRNHVKEDVEAMAAKTETLPEKKKPKKK